jgi:uncharacterized protein (DUF1684 family)
MCTWFSVGNLATAQNNYADQLNMHRLRYTQGFLQDPRSPLDSNDIKSLEFFSADSTWKLTCQCKLTENPRPFELPTYSGVTRTYLHYATARCERGVEKFDVRLYKNMTQPGNPLYGSNLFLPFKDASNDEQTYGGGRYINLSVNDIENQQIVIDFNTCYNPWCAYSSGYNCPVPPIENHFSFAVAAGEKQYKGKYKTKK